MQFGLGLVAILQFLLYILWGAQAYFDHGLEILWGSKDRLSNLTDIQYSMEKWVIGSKAFFLKLFNEFLSLYMKEVQKVHIW